MSHSQKPRPTSRTPIILPITDDPISDREDDAPIFQDERLGPWDGRWVLETVPLRDGEWVVYFASNLIAGKSTGVEIVDNGPMVHRPRSAEAECTGECRGTGNRKSRKYGACDEDYLNELCRKAEQDAQESATAQCASGCKCANGTFTATTRQMKDKGDYCKYRCYGEYVGTCVPA